LTLAAFHNRLGNSERHNAVIGDKAAFGKTGQKSLLLWLLNSIGINFVGPYLYPLAIVFPRVFDELR